MWVVFGKFVCSLNLNTDEVGCTNPLNNSFCDVNITAAHLYRRNLGRMDTIIEFFLVEVLFMGE